jgi:hypothetical protein
MIETGVFWGVVTLLAGGAIFVPLTIAMTIRHRWWWPFLLPVAGLAVCTLLAANAIDVSTMWGRVAHVPLFILVLIALAVLLFLISESPINRVLSIFVRSWAIIAFAMLIVEIGFRIFPAHDSFAINPGNRYFWHDWVYFKLNSFGHRDREFGKKTEDTYRVLLLGDSFTEGAGLDRAETFGRLAEADLKAFGDGKRVEIFNLGHAGANTKEEMDVLRRDGPALKPDLVILSYVFNDAETRPNEPPYMESPAWFAPVHAAFLDRLGSYAYYNGFTHFTFSKLNFANYVDFYAAQHEPSGRGWRGVVTALDEMQTWLADRHVGGVALVWPLFESSWPRLSANLRAQVDEALSAHGFFVVDLLPDFLAAQPDLRTFALSKIDSHPNAAANRLAAAKLVEVIRRQPSFIRFASTP